VTPTSVSLYWNVSSDNIGTTRYEVYRNGVLIQTTPLTNFTDVGLDAGTSYSYMIKARDGSSNVSQGASINATPNTPSNFLFNGSFELGNGALLYGWTKDPWLPDQTIMTWEATASGRNGTRCISIENTGENDVRWWQEISGLTPNNRYTVKGYMKGQSIGGSGITGANFCVMGIVNTNGLIGTFDWTYQELTFTAPASGKVTIGCRLGMNGSIVTGKAWFDDVTVVAVP
jgi:hypothetical protein